MGEASGDVRKSLYNLCSYKEGISGERDHGRISCYCRDQVSPALAAAPWKISTSTPCATATAAPEAQIIYKQKTAVRTSSFRKQKMRLC